MSAQPDVQIVCEAPTEKTGPLFVYPDVITGQTPGWERLVSEAGTQVHVPFEGVYESKGGRIQSPWFSLDKPAGEPACYRLAFKAQTDTQCYWWVDFEDAAGHPLPDVNSAVYASGEEQTYDQMLYVMGAAARIRLAFQSKEAVTVRDIVVERVSNAAAAAWGDGLLATLPPFAFEAPPDAFSRLPRTAAAINEGRPWRVVMLGDSIQNDSFNSVFQALVQRDFPDARLDFVISVRGSTGCWYYQDPDAFKEYVARHRPDLLLIGGISNMHTDESEKEDGEAIRRVIDQAHALGCEVALLSPPHSADWRPFDADHPEAPLPEMTWTEETRAPKGSRPLRWRLYRDLADAADIAFWDVTRPMADYVAASRRPHDWFNRDYVHDNDRGKQIIGRILHQYFRKAGDVPCASK